MEKILFEFLLDKIVSGSYPPGERMPSENVLAEEFQVSRITVRNAFTMLESMGYIYSVQGKGRFLKDRHKTLVLNLSGAESFSDKMKQSGVELKTLVTHYAPVEYNSKVFGALTAAADEIVIRIDRLRLINNLPVALHISWLKESRFPDILEKASAVASLFSYFRSKGLSGFTSSRSLMSLTFPSSEESELLGCPSLVPLLLLESDTRLESTGEVLQFTKILYRGDVFNYVI